MTMTVTLAAVSDMSHPVREANGDIVWRDMHGRPHRSGDLPAIEAPEGTQHWYIHGLRHRENGPSTIYANGSEEWRQHDRLHRIDGPAYIDTIFGETVWAMHGARHRENAPAVVYDNGDTLWYHEGLLHRVDGPAISEENRQEWYVHGEAINASADLHHIALVLGPALRDEDALHMLATASNLVLPILYHLLAHNPSEFLSNRVRGLAALAI